ncbi:MAG: sigma 54-interacting transcriptional regulator [Chromatiaceae bacterium]|jgi:PAS domain S-box-containing protein
MTDLVELTSLVNTHDRPFIVIGRDFEVVAVNRAYEKAFNKAGDALVGRKCHEVLHEREHPCSDTGEECPYVQCYATEEHRTCLHTHHDSEGRTRWVRIHMYPIRCADGTTYVGELLQEIAARGDDSEELRPVGNSPVFVQAMEQLAQAARTDAPVLLIGETGTGKELAARFIHRYSAREGHPFVAVDCTVITETLFESEVFGHERGAFTGSIRSRPGLFEAAGRGTVFIDEIGEASLATQAKLLRVLESGEFRRVGSNDTIEAQARVICATNRELGKSVQAGEFREDLFYRIACFRIRIPSLREHLDDVPVIAEALLRHMGRADNRVYRLDEGATELLLNYHYPGNVRELRNILRVAVAHLGHDHRGVITRDAIAHGLGMRDHFASAAPGPRSRAKGLTLAVEGRGQATSPRREGPATADELPRPPAFLETVEAGYLSRMLREHGGNRRRVAKAMGISERTLYRRLAKYELKTR